MMKRGLSVAVAVVAAVFVLTGPVLAADSFGARLRGVEETPVPISTAGQGFFFATLNAAETQLDYTVVYFGLGSAVTQSHIHFGPPGISGGIVLFFCTNLTPPAAVPTAMVAAQRTLTHSGIAKTGVRKNSNQAGR